MAFALLATDFLATDPTKVMEGSVPVLARTKHDRLSCDEKVPSLFTREFWLFYDEPFHDDGRMVQQVLALPLWTHSHVCVSSATLPDMRPFLSLPALQSHVVVDESNTLAAIECDPGFPPTCRDAQEVAAMLHGLARGAVARHFVLGHCLWLRQSAALHIGSINLPDFPLSVANVQPAGVLAEWKALLRLLALQPDAVVRAVFRGLAAKVYLARVGLSRFTHTRVYVTHTHTHHTCVS